MYFHIILSNVLRVSSVLLAPVSQTEETENPTKPKQNNDLLTSVLKCVVNFQLINLIV